MSGIHCIVVLGLLVTGCASESGGDVAPGRPGQDYDTRPIDVTAFPADPGVVQRVLDMPFGEAAARLGSLAFEGRSHVVFSRGAEEYEQHDVYRARQDSRGDLHAVLDTPASQVEVYLVGETLYIRHDKGHLRMKSRRDVDSEPWSEIAFGSWQQSLALFGRRIGLSDPTPDSAAGREAVRYRIALVDTGGAVAWPLARPPHFRLPVAAPARWREQATPLDLRGQLWLDTASGVVTRLSMSGRLEVADRAVRPTELTVHFEGVVSDVGKVAAVKPPSAVPEIRREKRDPDPLSFFREHLDELPPKPAAPQSR